MKNYAGRADADDEIAAELTAAGIPVCRLPEILRKHQGEVQTVIVGDLHGWEFKRAWRYWVCGGPGIEIQAAERLHDAHGTVVRVAGHCGCPSPREWFKGLACGSYHVDTQEGLNALAATIKSLVEGPTLETPVESCGERYAEGFNLVCRRAKGHAGAHAQNPRVIYNEEPV
jgi:hypothetical protein